MTRSPLTVSLSLLFLGADSVLNTLILSGNEILDSLHWQCNLGIIATVIGQMGFMMSTGLRIYRISKVYNTYLGYLENQKVELSKPTTESIESEATFTRLLSNDPMNEEIYSSKKGSSNNTESGKGKKAVATHEKKFTDAFMMTRTTSDVKTAEEQKEFEQMNALKERNILLKGLLFFLLPAMIFGGLSMLFPGVYTIFPVQESSFCICGFL